MRAVSEGLDIDRIISRQDTRRANLAIALVLWLLGLLMSQTWSFERFCRLICPSRNNSVDKIADAIRTCIDPVDAISCKGSCYR